VMMKLLPWKGRIPLGSVGGAGKSAPAKAGDPRDQADVN
jgi:hypothetical protein